ncbi:MAG: hypothetical protein DMF50_02190 [Acidobacteria bacterium]|nr:MAG: hypothetical protein DMF50_02190 [Acidobacteriota bacterium]
MGALWSTGDERDAREVPEGPLDALLRVIDLRRLRPYHAPTSGAARRERAARGAHMGIWMEESAAMRQLRTDRLRSWLRFALHTDDTPPRAALAFALGVFIAWTPLLGLHTVLALGLAFALGLNRVAVLAGTFVNNPWTLVPIYSVSVYLGSLILGTDLDPPRFEGFDSWSDIGTFIAQCRPWIVPLTVGTLVLGTISALLAFPIILYGIRWYRTLRHAG